MVKGIKLIGLTSITYIDKTGKRKRTNAKKEKELFAKLNEILKKAEKEGNLWKEQ